MNVYKTKELDIQLYQVSPNATLLNFDISEIKDVFLENNTLENESACIQLIKDSKTLLDLIKAFAEIEDTNYRARMITAALNRFMSDSTQEHEWDWDRLHRGIRISHEYIFKAGQYRDIRSVMLAQLRFDRFTDDKPIFNIVVRNPLYFSSNLNTSDFSEFLRDRRKIFLPAYDRKNDFNNILRSVDNKEIFFYEKRTRSNPNPKRIGDRFIKAGRMSQEEYDRLEQSNIKFFVCFCTSYSNYQKHYCYPARDIEIVASDSLLKLKNDNDQLAFPEELLEAVDLYRFAKSNIREQMDAKSELLRQVDDVLGRYFDISPSIRAECHYLRTPRYKLKGRTQVNQAVKAGEAYYTDGVAELGINALCYPRSESTPEREKKFLSFFSPTSKITSMGFEFQLIPFSSKMAVSNPVKTADRIVSETGHCNAALLVWPNWSNLPNNKLIEFELMRRGVAVQNVINQNFKLDAPKISALIKGMAEKFPVTEAHSKVLEGSIAPFHFALGLDVSRHGNMDIASFPIVIDRKGQVFCTFSDTPYTEDKEKRSVSEILRVIMSVLQNQYQPNTEHINILFLRDGIAYEDYQQVADQLPDNVSLTVVSVRKNLLNVCSEDLPEGEFYSLYSQIEDNRFVFGVNARQGEEAKITRLHLAQVVLNPLGLEMDKISKVLIALACQNKTTEVEIASLPFPIAYADRMAWTIRDMIQDRQLCKHVSENYPVEVDKAGGATLFIYQEIKSYVENRANGFAFAI